MRNAVMPHNLLVGIFLVVVLVGGCGGHVHQQREEILRPPPNADPAAANAMLEGNRLFSEHQWTTAREKYEAAVRAQPTLAEAHYNLAVTLDHQGRFSESRPHYIKAAKLAPGNTVIQNAPPFRRYERSKSDSKSEAQEGGSGHSH
jgi:Tfp pilus assembly protein PilF